MEPDLVRCCFLILIFFDHSFAKSPIPGLAGKHIVHIACGSSYCAAVTDEGALYTWGSGENGRLGHGAL